MADETKEIQQDTERIKPEKVVDPHTLDPIREKFPDELEFMGVHEEFERMPYLERVQHWALMICFFTLVLTGLPLFFKENSVAQAIFGFRGGFALRGILHRIAGAGLILVSIFHIGYIVFSKQGNQHFRAILPRLKDMFDPLHTFMHNLGVMSYFKRKGYFPALFNRYSWISFENPPRFDRYNFKEKFEYFALVWGNLIMIVTGLMMWFLEASLAIFPKWFLDVVRVIHGYEALLALLAIVIWHMYNVHFNPEVFPMSRIWLSGKIGREEFRDHHPLEYEQLLLERKRQTAPDNQDIAVVDKSSTVSEDSVQNKQP